MNFSEFRQYAEEKIAGGWAATPIAYENVPDSAALMAAKTAKTPWIRFVIRDGDGARITIGADSRLDRFVGVIFISIFVAQGSGTRTAAGYADNLATLWKSSGVDCIRLDTPSVAVIGERDGWFQINVSVSFQNDELS